MEGDVGSREGFLKWQKQEHDCTLVGKSELRGKINHVGAKGTVAGGLILLGKKTCTHAWVGGRPRTGGTAGAAVGGRGKQGRWWLDRGVGAHGGSSWEIGSQGLGLWMRGWREEGSGSMAERVD